MLKLMQPLISERLMRAFAMQGDLPDDLLPASQASITTEDLTDHQYLWLQRTVSFAAGDTAPAVLARNSGFVLEPVNAGASSGKVVRLRRLILSGSSAGQSNISFGVIIPGVAPAKANTTVITPCVKDSRINQAGGTMQFVKCTTVIAFTPGHFITLLPNVSEIVPLDMTIVDNGAVFFVTVTSTNQSFGASLEWEERDSVSSELR